MPDLIIILVSSIAGNLIVLEAVGNWIGQRGTLEDESLKRWRVASNLRLVGIKWRSQ